MKNVPIHVTPHHVELSSRSRNFIEKKLLALSRIAHDMIGADVVLRGKDGAAQLFSVSARIALPGRDLQANATHANLYGAVNQLAERLARLARKRKTRFSTALRRSCRKADHVHQSVSADWKQSIDKPYLIDQLVVLAT